MNKLQIIVGSIRQMRSADVVTNWIADRARKHGGFEVEVLDLREWDLPMFDEHHFRVGDITNPTYSSPVVQAWNAKLKEADGYFIIAPEYNHSISGVLKNALDCNFLSFAMRNKVMCVATYGGGPASGARAAEHLAHMAIEADTVPMRNNVIIPNMPNAFDDNGEPRDPMSELALKVALEDLDWWSTVLRKARAEGELPSGMARMRAARMAAMARKD